MTTIDVARSYDLLEHEATGFPAHRPDLGDDWSPEDDVIIGDMLDALDRRAKHEVEDALEHLRTIAGGHVSPEQVEAEAWRIEQAVTWLGARDGKRRQIAQTLAEEHREAQDEANAARDGEW